MSENLLIAIIGLAGAVLAALIGAFGAIVAAEIKGKKEGGASDSSGLSCGIIGLAASVMGAFGLVLGVFFGAYVVQNIEGIEPQPTEIVQQLQPSSPTVAVQQTSPTATNVASPTPRPAAKTEQPSQVLCVANGREPLPGKIQCTSGKLSVSIKVVGNTEYPAWDRKFNGLVSQIDLASNVKARVRVEQWGPPGVWNKLEHAGWLTLHGSNNMASEFTMLDEISKSDIKIIPNDMSQALEFSFDATSENFFVARICENVNPCGGQVVEFTFIP